MSKNGLAVESIRDIELHKLANRSYKSYGEAVLEDRAFPDFRDGLNPVNRRLLWASYQMGIRHNSKVVKAARVVGDTLGRYHPHGDSSVYGALVKMTQTNSAIPLFDGEGNWGSISDKSCAAMRYTECRLSKFSDEIIFNKFYVPALDYVPNYDSSTVEPLVLPSLLPIVLINGRFGIAPGAQTNIPTCDYKSLLKTLHGIYSGEKITPEYLYDNIKFTSTYGGVEQKPSNKEDKDKRRSVFKTPSGAAVINSVMTYDAKTHTVKVSAFARDTDMEKLVETLSDLEGIQYAADSSTTTDRYGELTIVFKKGLKETQYDKLLKYVEKTLSSSEKFTLNFTKRYIDETGQGKAHVVPMSMTQMLTEWVEWRTELERRACAYWIKEDEKEIRRLQLLAQAVDLIDFILKLLKNDKLDADQVYAAYAKKAKIKPEEAKYVLNRPIISLRKLEKTSLNKQIREVEASKAKLEKRHKKPHVFMAEQIKEWAKLATPSK